MRLLIGLYGENDPARCAEIATCLVRNVWLFPQTTIFLEDERAQALFEPFFGKSEQVPLGHRLTYAEALGYPATPGTVNVLANNDILFDSTIFQSSEIPTSEFWCITRRESDNRFPPCPEWTQDAWVWKTPAAIELAAANFPLGVPGCDNRIAYEAERAGYQVRNPGSRIRLAHRHASGVRRPLPRLVGGYAYIPLDC